MAIRFAGTIIKNIRMEEFNGIGEYPDSICRDLPPNDIKSKETIVEDYADSFKL